MRNILDCYRHNCSVKEDERESQGHTSRDYCINLLPGKALNMCCFYMRAFSTSCFILTVMDGKIEHCVFITFYVRLSKSATKTPEMFCEALENIL